MKIAIQANPNRGKEIISLLKSLGGRDTSLEGDGEIYTYYVDGTGIIQYDEAPKDYKVYTLEEFEKEFPFKIGDRVISITTGYIGTITKLSENGWYYVNYDNGNFACAFGQNLKPYKEMERNVTLTLDKAKEWYKKGGELKEVALQAYSEEELTKVDLPKTWEEFCNNFPLKNEECYVGTCSDITMMSECVEGRDIEMDKNVYPSRKSAEAHLAMIQLEQLRNCWWNGWEPMWDGSTKYTIKRNCNEISVIRAYNTSAFLAFPTREMAEEFLKCFRDLIEKAGDLI